MMRNATIENQYRIATTAAALISRTDRGLLDVTGKDRAAWLHNLVTNAVRTLQPGDGNYAFATNVKGRALFDLNILVLEDRLCLDIDRRWLDAARKHLTKYTITEDVAVADASKDFDRLAVLGPAAVDIVGSMGLGNLKPMAQLQHVGFVWQGHHGRMIRHDFGGLTAAEFLLPLSATDSFMTAMLDAGRPLGLARIDRDALEILRIEAGMPAPISEINEDVVPPETGQIERGISYHKGCYLGQEVIERMRSHGIMAKRMVGIRFEGEQPLPVPTPLVVGEAETGRLTSVCWSYALGAMLGLGYVRTVHAKVGQALAAVTPEGQAAGEVVTLPLR